MKRNDITKLHQLSVAELEAQATELANQLNLAKMKLAVGKLKNSREVYTLRKDIARIKTIIRTKQLQQVAQEEPTVKAAAEKTEAKPAKK